MDFGGSRFELDSRVHVSSESVSLALWGAAVVPLSVVGASRCALALEGLLLCLLRHLHVRGPPYCEYRRGSCS